MIEAVCLDLDKTLIQGNQKGAWPMLNSAMGMTDKENALFYTWHQEGLISYTEWVNLAFKIYKERKNLKSEEIMKVISQYTYLPHAEKAVEYLLEKYIVVLISCSMNLVVERVANELGIYYSKALSEFDFDRDGYLRRITVDDKTGEPAENKLIFLMEFCTGFNIPIENIACIGDGETDMPLFRSTGLGVTFENASDECRELAWQVIPGLEAIPQIL